MYGLLTILSKSNTCKLNQKQQHEESLDIHTKSYLEINKRY